MLDSTLSLCEMETLLDELLQEKKGSIRMLGDLDLSLEDYKILSLRLRGFAKYHKNFALYQKYALSLLAMGVFAFRYEDNGQQAMEKIDVLVKGVPQHLERALYSTFDTIFQLYKLSTYGIEIQDYNSLLQVLMIQCGLSEQSYVHLFNMFDSMDQGDLDEREKIMLVRKLEELNSSSSLNSEVKAMLLQHLFTVYKDCKEHSYTKEELYKRYEDVSNRLIEATAAWCGQNTKSLEIRLQNRM